MLRLIRAAYRRCLVVAPIALLLSGCSFSLGGPEEPVKGRDACTLLTTAEIAKATGHPVLRVRHGDGEFDCIWDVDAGPTWTYVNLYYQNIQDSPKTLHSSSSDEPGNSDDTLFHLMDDAVGIFYNSQLWVRQGDTVFVIQVRLTGLSPQPERDLELRLARLALPRI